MPPALLMTTFSNAPSARRRIAGWLAVFALAAAPSIAGQAPPGGSPAPLRPLAILQLDERARPADLDAIRPITVSVAEPVPVVDLLLMLVRGTRLSIAADPDVTGTFRGELNDVSLRQAMLMILAPQGLDYSVQGNLIRVFRRRLETRRYDLNYVMTRRVRTRSLTASNAIGAPGAPSGAGAGATVSGSTLSLAADDAGDVFDDLAAGVKTLLSGEGRFNLDRKAALLQVTDYPERLDQVQAYVEAVHRRATRQVHLQARVLEIALRDEFAAGINWSLVLARAGAAVSTTSTPPAAGAATFAGTLVVRDFAALLGALAGQGEVTVLANPVVQALNNEPVVLRLGTQDVYFRTAGGMDDERREPRHATVEPQALTEGIVLGVTPQVGDDGMISLSLSPSVTARTGEATSPFGDAVPVLAVREADTVARVRDAETIVLAGLIDARVRREQRRVPVLGHLPGIGAAFRGERTRVRRTDLVILLTPTIVAAAPAAAADGGERERAAAR